jgi:hypothetical protein
MLHLSEVVQEIHTVRDRRDVLFTGMVIGVRKIIYIYSLFIQKV